MKKLFGRQQTSEPPVSFRANATQLERINRYLEEQSEEPALVVTVSPRGTSTTSNTTTVMGTGTIDGSNTSTPNGFAHLEESGENVGETSSDVAVSAVGDVERDEQHHQHHNPSPADGEVFDSADKEHPVVGKKNIHNNNKDISINNSKISTTTTTTSQECEAMNSDSPLILSTDNQQVVPLHGTTPSPSTVTPSPTTNTNTSINSPQLLLLQQMSLSPPSASSSSSSPSSSPTTSSSSGSSPTLHHQPKPLPKRPPVSAANNSNNGTIPTSTKTLPVPVKAMPVPPAKTAATINHYSNNNNNHKVTPVPTTATTTTPSTSSSSTTSVAEKLFSTSPSSTSSLSNNNNNKGSPSTISSEQNMLAAAMEANQQQKVLELTQEIEKIPQFIRDAISDVEQRGLRSEGIFRLGSPKNKMDDAWQLILETPPQNLHELRIDFVQRGDVNLTANILKKYFRELREPLIPFDLYHAFLNAGKTSNTAIPVTPTAIVDQKKELSEKEQLIVKELKAACDQLPPVRRKVLSMLCELWWKVACNQPTNRMTPYNISVVVQPNILYSRTRTPMEVMANMKHEQRVVSDFVIYYELLLKDESNSNSNRTSDSNSQSPTEANAGSIGTDGGAGGDKTPPSTEPTSSSNSSPSSQSPSKGTDNNSSNSGDDDKKKEEEVAQAIVSEQQLLMEVQKRRNILHNVTEKTFSGRGVYTGTVNSSGMMQGVGTLRLLNGSVYTGEFVLSQYHGSGELTEANGAKFVGKWYCGKRLGKGVMTYADKSKYEGDWMEDQRSGTGAMVYADDSVYEGGWHQDKYDGDGAFRSDDVKYIGRWSNGLYHGSGALEDYVKKQIYKGEFANGLYHGKGRLRSINPQSGKCKFKGQFQEGKPYSGKGSIAVDMNTTLTGKWIDGKLEGTALIMYDKDDDARAGYKGQVDSELKPHGKGIMRYKDDTEYAGQWEHGMKCGEGTLLMSSDNLTYEGQFQNDQFHGHGKLIDASHRVAFEGDFNQGIPRSGSGSIKLNGNTYNGTFYDGNFFGRGTIRNPSDGSIYEGSLEDGLYHGQGKLTYSDGSTFKGRFVGNCKVEGVFRDECGREYSVEYSLEGIEKKRERLHRELSIDDRREMAQHNTGVIVNSWTEILRLKQQQQQQQQQQQPEQPTIEIDHKLLSQFQASIQHLMSDDRSVPHLQPVLEMMTQMSLFLKKQSSTTEEQ